MSLFSRLKEERMRARDSQDDSKESAPADDGQGGLFGSVQLKPAQNQSSVPPPATAMGMAVPSLEEARAELDRIRAQNAQDGPSSGLFRRDKTFVDEASADTPRPAVQAPGARESVSFEAVSLPPREAETAPVDSAPVEEVASQTTFAPTISPLPTLATSEVSATEVVAPQVAARDSVNDVASGEGEFRAISPSQSAIEDAFLQAAPDSALDSAPTMASSHSNSEQTIYAPTTSDANSERQIIARTEPQAVAGGDIATPIEELRSTEVRTEIRSDAPTAEIQEAPRAQTVQAGASPIDAPRAAAGLAEPVAAPPSNLTPFQRLMAARAAQGGSAVSRQRNERPAPRPTAETAREVLPQSEAPEAAESAPLVSDTPAPQATVEAELPQLELPQSSASPIELPTVEVPAAAAPQIEAPSLDEPPLPTDAASALGAPVELPPSPLDQADEEAALPLAASAGFAVGEASVAEPSAAMPEIEAPAAAATPEVTEPQATEPEGAEPEASEMEMMAAKADALVAQTREKTAVAADTDADADSEEPAELAKAPAASETEEAEIVPEELEVTASSQAQSPSEMPLSETVEPPARPTLSLAERLARAPRAELDTSHAEAESLTPEIPTDSTREVAAPRAAPLSFAERLAARNKPQVEPAIPATSYSAPAELPIPATSYSAPAELPTSATSYGAPAATPDTTASTQMPGEPSFAKPDAQANVQKDVQNAPRSSGESSSESAPERGAERGAEPAPRSGPRSFTERLAARTGLDSHLQVPAPESAPTPQDLATHNTELARINEGVGLSDREAKNRVLFRQKHLIFDSVLGSIDQRTMQNPTREAAKPQIEKGVDAALDNYGLELESYERNWLVDEFTREVTDLGALVPMLEDPSVSKIVVTGANDVSVERLGRIERTGVSFRDDDHLLSLVRRIAELSGGRVDAKVPLLDRPLPDGGRIRAKVPPLAPQPTVTIEKSTGNPFVVLKRQMDEKARGDSLPYAQLRERIQQRLLREFEGDAAALSGDQDKLRGQVEEMIGSVIAEEHVAVTRAERASLVMDLLNEIVGLGPIEPLLNDPDVDEVMVNGPYQIYVERKGKLELTNQRFRDNGHVMQVIDRIVAPLGRRVDEKSPMVDGRLRDGSRFNAIIPPLALSGPTMTIRKFARDPFTMSDLINFGTITREAAQFLQASVEGRLNIVVSGGTGSGKTTTLNVLSSFIPSTERIVTIEDAAELQMRQEHVIRMETRPPNIEGVGEVGIRDLVKNSLRMRPDRIVVGECRGGEALDMLQAMNTGHDGSLTTAHSNGPRDTCKRLETMVMMAGFDLPVRAIREQISMAVQLVVHQERMRDGKRRVTAITEIVGMEGDVLTMQDIFRFEQEGMDDDGRIIGSLQATGMRPKYYETIIDNGGTISMDIFSPKSHEAAPRAKLNERGGR